MPQAPHPPNGIGQNMSLYLGNTISSTRPSVEPMVLNEFDA